MNRFRSMRFLFNAGRRSQQVIGLFNKNRNNKMKGVFSTISMIMSALSVGKKISENFRSPAQKVSMDQNQNKNQTQAQTQSQTRRSRTNMSLQPLLAEYADEFLNSDEFKPKNTKGSSQIESIKDGAKNQSQTYQQQGQNNNSK